MGRAAALLRADALAAIVFFAVSGLIIGLSWGYPPRPISEAGGPALYPRLVAGILAVLATMVMVRAWREKTEPIRVSKRQAVSLLTTLVLLVVMIYMLKYLGFLISSFVFLTASILFFRGEPVTVRSILYTILISAGITGVAYATFWWGAKVPLPIGIFFGGI